MCRQGTQASLGARRGRQGWQGSAAARDNLVGAGEGKAPAHILRVWASPAGRSPPYRRSWALSIHRHPSETLRYGPSTPSPQHTANVASRRRRHTSTLGPGIRGGGRGWRGPRPRPTSTEPRAAGAAAGVQAAGAAAAARARAGAAAGGASGCARGGRAAGAARRLQGKRDPEPSRGRGGSSASPAAARTPPPPRAPAARADMSEADRVPSPAAPPVVAVDERKGKEKEPEREKLPPIVSAGASATAVGAWRRPRGTPTTDTGREDQGHPGAVSPQGSPGTPGRCAQAPFLGPSESCALWTAAISWPAAPSTLGKWGARVRGTFSVIFWVGRCIFSKDQHLGVGVICRMRIRCQAGGSGFSTELPACLPLRSGDLPLFFPSSSRLNGLRGEFPLK